MSRQDGLHLALQEPVFTTQYRVIYGDTDAAGVMYNANYLRLFEIGRTEMMRAWAMPYREMEEMGCVLPVTESYLRFKAPARYDDLVDIAVSLVEAGKFTCRFHYQITRREQEGKTSILNRGFTVHACVNRQGALMAFPAAVRTAIRKILDQRPESAKENAPSRQRKRQTS